jgi:hypothetical protein
LSLNRLTFHRMAFEWIICRRTILAHMVLPLHRARARSLAPT